MGDWVVTPQSSAIQAVRYDGEALTLDIRFAGNREYRFFGVSAGTYQSGLDASSKGTWYNEYIKDRYQYTTL